MFHPAVADIAGVVPASARRALTGALAKNASGGTLYLQFYDLAAALDTNQKTAARLAATGALVAGGWTPAGAGVGKTLTAPSDSTTYNDFDSVTANLNDRVLVKNEGAGDEEHNGLYRVSTLGNGAGASTVLTRVTDLDQDAEVPGAYVLVTAGTTLGGTAWYVTSIAPVVDTDPIAWAARTPLLTLEVKAGEQFPLPLLRMTRAGMFFESGIAWGWSSALATFVAYGTAANVSVDLFFEVP